MSDIAAENDVSRGIRPVEAVKAWQSIEKSAVRIVAEKAKAWHNWTRVIGPFIIERKAKATAETGTTRGTKYAAALQKALGQFYPIFKKISDNGSASHLMQVMDNLAAIEKWLAKQPADDRPSHPSRVLSAYEASQPIISFKDAAPTDPDADAEDDAEDNDNEADDDKPARKRARRSTAGDHERRVEELEEELGKYRLSTSASDNASRIWLALRDIVGHEAAVDLARATADELLTLIDKVEGMWKEAS